MSAAKKLANKSPALDAPIPLLFAKDPGTAPGMCLVRRNTQTFFLQMIYALVTNPDSTDITCPHEN